MDPTIASWKWNPILMHLAFVRMAKCLKIYYNEIDTHQTEVAKRRRATKSAFSQMND